MAQPGDSVAELAPRYYRDNFLKLCATVSSQYGDLLSEEEIQFLSSFNALPENAQCLYVRLISRVGPWFRVAKLNYPEIQGLPHAVTTMLDCGLLTRLDAFDVETIGRLYTKPELVAAAGDSLPGLRQAAKSEILSALQKEQEQDSRYLSQLVQKMGGDVVGPLAGETVAVLQLLFFGNRWQSLTEFVLDELGVAPFYPYELRKEERLFQDRAALEEYLACSAYRELLFEMQELKDFDGLVTLADTVMGEHVQYGSTFNGWNRLLNTLSRELERRDELDRAEVLYARSSRHPARERRARVLETQGNLEAAAGLCRKIVATPWCEEEGDAAGRMLPRIERNLGLGANRRRVDNFEQRQLHLPATTSSVELAAAEALAADWSSVHYVENALFNGLFGLAFWEQIFAPVKGAFHNRFQSGPTDMFEREFYANRRAELDARLTALAELDLDQLYSDAYNRYYPYQCRWLNWRHLTLELLQHTVRVVPVVHLQAIFRRQLFDPRENRSGFPDLIALGQQPGDYCLIEVKGPGDALQHSQKRWLRYFEREQIPAEVAWVTWIDD